MILVICEKCGAWEDKTIAEAWANAWQPVGKALAKGLAEAYGLKVEKQPTEKPAGWPCPVDSTRGLMRAVTTEDRLLFRPAMVETEQGESEITSEQEESEKRQQIIDEIGTLADRRLGLIGMNDVKHASTARLEELLATVKENAQYL